MKFSIVIFLIVITNFAFSNTPQYLPIPTRDIVKHTFYTLSYNERYEQANWVYYSLTDSMVMNSVEERSNNFKMDRMVKTISAKSSDYTNSGYDRGHLCPAADMGFDPVAMDESFLMSNISPQMPDFNRGVWKELEMTVRKWAISEHQLYVVTGPIFKSNKGLIGKEEVLVPGYFYKIIYDPTDDPKLIAFVFPNEKSDRPLTDFAVPVNDAEQLTGLDFFSQLPDETENRLEEKVLLAGWFAGYVIENTMARVDKTETTKSDIYFYMSLVGIILIVAIFVWLWNKRMK